jgi:hypothetical protein
MTILTVWPTDEEMKEVSLMYVMNIINILHTHVNIAPSRSIF